MKKKIIAALALVLLVSSVTSGKTVDPIEPVEQDLFRPFIISASIPVLRDYPFDSKDRPILPRLVSKPKVEPKIKPKPKKSAVVFNGGVVKGKATFMCRGNGNGNCHYKYPDRPGVADLYAAAGPAVRKLLGPNWRGKTVKVMANGNTTYVKLIDWCQCHKGTSDERVLDLYYDAAIRLYSNFGELGKKTVRVQRR